MPAPLLPFFHPRTIALIGASDRPGSLGKMAYENLCQSGFKGEVYPINLRRPVLGGEKSLAYIREIPEPVDLAIVATPPHTVEKLITECANAEVKNMLILSQGFKRKGPRGVVGYKGIRSRAGKYPMRIMGPNSLGFINVAAALNASLIPDAPQKGKLAIISQSGAVLTALLDMARDQKVGCSHVISTGVTTNTDLGDLIDFLGTDSRTASILIYLENLPNPRKFLSAARAFVRSKPIIVLKAARSEEGVGAAQGHFGAQSGDDAAYDAAFRRAGIIRVNTLAQLFNCGLALDKQPRPADHRLAILTNAGGPAVLAVDYLIQKGGRTASLKAENLRKLKEDLSVEPRGKNPIDLFATAQGDDFKKALQICLRDQGVDGVLVILSPRTGVPLEDIAQAVVEVSAKMRKPVLASWMGGPQVKKAREILEKGGVPNYRYPESAIDVFLFLHEYAKRLELLYETPPSVPRHLNPDQEGVRKIMDRVRSESRLELNELESKELLKCYQIPVVHSRKVSTPAEAVEAAEAIGFPVVLKVLSRDLVHKSEVGGLRLNLFNEQSVYAAYREIQKSVKAKRPHAILEGMLVEPMVDGRMELLFRARRDPILGPVIAFGQGGVGADIFRDYSIEIPPLNMALAHRLLEGTRIYPLLKGYRGAGGVDLHHLAVTLYKFAYLLMDFPDIQEVSINPFLAGEKGGLGVDAHLTLSPTEATPGDTDYAHLIISPYPSQYVRETQLRDGRPVLLRPIRPEDEPLEMSMMEYLSKQTLYLRFFGQVPKVTHEWLSRFTHIDYDREMAIIAELEEDGVPKMIGVVRIIQDLAGETAEYAITVADPWQGQGLGSILTDFILEVAQDKGMKKIYATVLATNDRMLALFRRKGFRIQRDDFETYSVELDL